MPQRGAERPASLGGDTALLNRFVNVRLQLFVDIAIHPIAANYINDSRPQRHTRPPAEHDSPPKLLRASATLRRQVASSPWRLIRTSAPSSRTPSWSTPHESSRLPPCDAGPDKANLLRRATLHRICPGLRT